MKRLWILILVLLLAGCNGKVDDKKTNDVIIAFTERAYAVNELTKEFIAELSRETVEDFVFQMKDTNSKLIALSEEYGEIVEGITDGENRKKVNCYKLPVAFTFSGDESLVNVFLDFIENADKKMVVNQFEIEEVENGYSVRCLVSFIGSSAKLGAGNASNTLSFVKKSKEVKEEEEIVLRDFDVNLTVRPSNSDAAAVAISTEVGNALYSDKNSAVDVNVEFYKEGTQNYCKYSVGEQVQIDRISINDEIKFDILSCEKKIDTDEVTVNLTIENSLAKKVSGIIYNDPDKRIKVTKTGSVEVSRK